MITEIFFNPILKIGFVRILIEMKRRRDENKIYSLFSGTYVSLKNIINISKKNIITNNAIQNDIAKCMLLLEDLGEVGEIDLEPRKGIIKGKEKTTLNDSVTSLLDNISKSTDSVRKKGENSSWELKKTVNLMDADVLKTYLRNRGFYKKGLSYKEMKKIFIEKMAVGQIQKPDWYNIRQNIFILLDEFESDIRSNG